MSGTPGAEGPGPQRRRVDTGPGPDQAEQRLGDLLAASAARYPTRTAVEDPVRESSITYDGLRALSDGVRDALLSAGVAPGDRVGLCAPKSIAAVASLFGVLKAGAAYVPVDPTAPAARNAFVLRDCAVRAALLDPGLEDAIVGELPGRFAAAGAPQVADLEPGLRLLARPPDAPREEPADAPAAGELAYILYTSGSTGKPKGVMHTHGSALSFVRWCSETFEPTERDRFSSHAPFHFDLSILDLFVPIRHGASVVLIEEKLGRFPPQLAPLIAERGLTVWYSTPSILRLMLELGGLAELDCPELRLVLFAGEVFPIKQLRALREAWRAPCFFNLYGPTETNVCTYHEVPSRIPGDRTEPVPIGRVCENDRAMVADGAGRELPAGEEGELYVTGGTVMAGYWNRPERTQRAFHTDPDGIRWYRTGDIVREEAEGDYTFLGRRDRMVKRRGYRVELGEIEAALYRHPRVSEAAAVSRAGRDGEVRIRAVLSFSEDSSPSVLQLRQFCGRELPLYMVPDEFEVRDQLPRTSTDKVDYRRLSEDS